MKKTLTAIAVSMVAIASASAQDIYDAFNFSQNFYQGTARSLAMGNAMTAVGGDLGSININPAGSAVAGYNQIAISPSVSLSTSTSEYTPVYGTDYTTKVADGYARLMLPNIGVTMNYKTGLKYGIKSMTFGIVANSTNDYTMSMEAQGINKQTTMLGAMATNAGGYTSSVLSSNDAYYRTYAPWNVISGYQAGAISVYGDYTDSYVGATEKIHSDNIIALAGALDQSYGMQRHGSKNDLVFNFGMNINDFIYLGANLGITSLSYQYDTYFKEAAVNTNDFDIDYANGGTLYFDNARNRYSYNATGEGIYLKVGGIILPAPGLRIGAAIQTPTSMYITERWQYANDVNFTDASFNGSAYSPEGEYIYRLRSPYRVNAGIAYSLLGMAMISVDYEMADYSTMKFNDADYSDTGSFNDVNRDIYDFAGVQHMLRVGAEYKPVAKFALRAGYNFTTSPEYTIRNNVKKNVKAPTQAFSVGAGYSSNGSFFADVAYRYTKYPYSYIQPYDDYIDEVYSPEIRRSSGISNIVMTVGWRF